MAQSQTTISGNLGQDPELRFTPTGVAVCRISVGVSDRRYNRETGAWDDGETNWYSVIAWRELAENMAETLTRGTRVVVSGQMKSRTYENREGQKVTVWELTADDVGASLKFAAGTMRRIDRTHVTAPDTSDPWSDGPTEPGTEPAGDSAGQTASAPKSPRARGKATAPAA